jgi:DNA-binding transcriptional ArsR family regulator
MGTSKTEEFTEKQNRLANFARAIGHPARVAILEHLLDNGKSNCGDIVQKLPLAQATISQHLKELKDAGLIKGNSKGNAVSYSVNGDAFGKFEKRMLNVFKKVRKYEKRQD